MVLRKIFKGFLSFEYVGMDEEKNHIELNPEKDQIKREKLIEMADEIFGNHGLTYGEFCNQYAKSSGKSYESGKKYHYQLKQSNIIIQEPEGGKWILNRNEVPAF